MQPTPECFDFRATVVGRTLTLAQWHPGLAHVGSKTKTLREREGAGVVIANLFINGEAPAREVLVSAPTGMRISETATEVLADWAQATGYARIWFDHEVHDFQSELAYLGAAHVTCPTCGTAWTEGGFGFWASVRSIGSFPTSCPACAALLPQWRIAEDANGLTSTDGEKEHGLAVEEAR